MICPCGQEILTTGGFVYQLAYYNEFGEIYYAVCMHGIVVIDARPEIDENDSERLGD